MTNAAPPPGTAPTTTSDTRLRAILVFLLFARDTTDIHFGDARLVQLFGNARIRTGSTLRLKFITAGQCRICLQPTANPQRLTCNAHDGWVYVHLHGSWTPEERRRRVVEQLVDLTDLPKPDSTVFTDDAAFSTWIAGISAERTHWWARLKQGSRSCSSCGTEAMESVHHTDEDGVVTWVRWICDDCLAATRTGGAS